MDAEFREKFITTLCAASLFSLTVLFFGPLYLYLTNILEFPYLFSDVWYLFAFISLLCILVISAVLLPLKPSIHRKAVSLLFAFAFLLWLQGNILVWNYGVLDGREIPWNNYKIYGLIDTAVWLVVVTFTFVKSNFIYNLIKKISIGLILIQIASIAIVWFQAPEQPEWKGYTLSEDSKYNFSSEKNVIILVLDTFQTDIFQELINEQPEYRDIFDGFTYFRNAVGGLSNTNASIPLILTGSYYDNSLPLREFMKNKFLFSSIPLILKQNGYQVDLFTDSRFIYCSSNIASNLIEAKNIINKKNTISYIYNITLFRYLPHFTKKYFLAVWDETNPHFSQKAQLDFAENIISESNATSGKYMFKFFHLWGTHPPFYLNERLELEKLEYDHNGYKVQAKASLEITKRFLSVLKKIGVYDNSLIFIIGDHGVNDSGLLSHGINVQASGYFEDNKITKSTPDYIIASGIPLILVKQFASKGYIKISDAPVSLSDIPKTIISELGLKGDFPGCSMFTVKESDIRERRFLEYKMKKDDWSTKAYLPVMNEYIVNGFSWLNQSWRPTYRRFTPSGVQDTRPPIYEYGSKIQFGDGGNAEQYQGAGWSEPENGFTWTDGKSAFLIIPVNQPQSDLILKAELIPFLSAKVNVQKVNIYISGEKLGEWNVTRTGDFRIVIPKRCITEPLLKINFELPDAASPLELNVSADPRKLGIAVQSITLSQPPIYEYGSVIKFTDGGNAEQYKGQGWSWPENDFTWTEGGNASLIIPVKQPQSDLKLIATLFPLVSDKLNKQIVNLNINGNDLGRWEISNAGSYDISIPREYINEPFLKIDFKLPDASSPLELNLNDDRRILGIAMQSVVVVED